MFKRALEYQWQCFECKSCQKCHRRQTVTTATGTTEPVSPGKRMIFCEQCDRGFHLSCVGLRKLPEARWHCTVCLICSRCGARSAEGHPNPYLTGQQRDSLAMVANWTHEYATNELTRIREHLVTLCVPCERLRSQRDDDVLIRLQQPDAKCANSNSSSNSSGKAGSTGSSGSHNSSSRSSKSSKTSPSNNPRSSKAKKGDMPPKANNATKMAAPKTGSGVRGGAASTNTPLKATNPSRSSLGGGGSGTPKSSVSSASKIAVSSSNSSSAFKASPASNVLKPSAASKG